MLGSPILRRRVALLSRGLCSASRANAFEMPDTLDRFDPNQGYLSGWRSWSASTLAIVQLRELLPGWGVPAFKREAGQIWADVGAALAAGDESRLRQLTTRLCFATMAPSLRERPAGQRQRWQTLDVDAKVRSVRIAHHASSPERRFAQITCSVEAGVVWTVLDKKGAVVGGVGSETQPHRTNDLVVFERCVSSPAEPPAWRLKEKTPLKEAG